MIKPSNINNIGPPQKGVRPEKGPEQKPRIHQFTQHQSLDVGQNSSNVIPLQPRQSSFIENLLGDG